MVSALYQSSYNVQLNPPEFPASITPPNIYQSSLTETDSIFKSTISTGNHSLLFGGIRALAMSHSADYCKALKLTEKDLSLFKEKVQDYQNVTVKIENHTFLFFVVNPAPAWEPILLVMCRDDFSLNMSGGRGTTDFVTTISDEWHKKILESLTEDSQRILREVMIVRAKIIKDVWDTVLRHSEAYKEHLSKLSKEMKLWLFDRLSVSQDNFHILPEQRYGGCPEGEYWRSVILAYSNAPESNASIGRGSVSVCHLSEDRHHALIRALAMSAIELPRFTAIALDHSEAYSKRINLAAGETEELIIDGKTFLIYRDTLSKSDPRSILKAVCQNDPSINQGALFDTVFTTFVPQEWHEKILELLWEPRNY